MNRAELEHVIRAAARIVDDPEIVIVGSQSILGTHPDAPPSLLTSREADVYPKNKPDEAIAIDANMGESSPFDVAFGYYAHGVGPETAKCPKGWQRRLVPVKTESTGGATGWCLEVHDLLLSKCAAGRERDWSFVEEALRRGLADPALLRRRLRDLPFDDERLAELGRLLEAAIARGGGG